MIDIPGAITLEIDNKSVEFDNVQFSYLPEQPILKGISFRVNSGETVALVNIYYEIACAVLYSTLCVLFYIVFAECTNS